MFKNQNYLKSGIELLFDQHTVFTSLFENDKNT